MKLDYDTIKSVTMGAVRITDDNCFKFYRFTEEQENQYKKYHNDLLYKTYSTAGVVIEFVTDTHNLYIDADFEMGSSRTYYAFDILCDNEIIESISNFNKRDNLLGMEFSLDNIKKNIVLKEGKKTLKIVFPWSVAPRINEISIDDNAIIEPVPKKDKMIFFGDSITHGYDASNPTESYVYRVADKLDVQIYNKAIGGECFFPELLEDKEDFEPKYISVAYGTNDWNSCSLEQFQNNCSEFYKLLTYKYPNTKIFAIAPIWRKDENEKRQITDFKQIRDYIFEIANKYDNVIFIDGHEFVPQDEKYYADLRLHPNSEGFRYYADSLYSCIKGHLE